MANLQNPVKAIRAKCLDCCCDQPEEVKAGPSQDCPLHPFRMGKNPSRVKREMSEEQRQKMSAVLAAAREKQKGGER